MYVWKYQMVFLLKGDSFSKQAKFVFLNRNAYICFKKLLVRKEITFFHGKLKAYEFFFGEMMLSTLGLHARLATHTSLPRGHA